MCVREFVRETKRSLDDVREHLYFLQYNEIDLWRSVQNFEYNIEDSSTIIRELFANTQPTQPCWYIAVDTLSTLGSLLLLSLMPP